MRVENMFTPNWSVPFCLWYRVRWYF